MTKLRKKPIVIKLKIFSCDKTQKLKLWKNFKTENQIGTKKLNCDSCNIDKSDSSSTDSSKNNLTHWAPLGSFSRFSRCFSANSLYRISCLTYGVWMFFVPLCFVYFAFKSKIKDTRIWSSRTSVTRDYVLYLLSLVLLFILYFFMTYLWVFF